MAAATDFLHDEAVVDGVIAELTAHLPATWLNKDNSIWGLQRIEFGDLREYEPDDTEAEDWLNALCPCILVRCNRVETADAWSGMGGKAGEAVPVRVLHAFTRAQCRDATDPTLYVQPMRARAQRAKIISKALWNDTSWRLGNPTLTTADSSAKVVSVERGPVAYEGEEFGVLPGEVFGLTIDLVVYTRTE